jgi:hypothetical protein
MISPETRAQDWPDGAEEQALRSQPPLPAMNEQTPPYWTLDTTTEEWVQHRRDGTEICRAPIKRTRQKP